MAIPRKGDIGTVFNGTVLEDGAAMDITGATDHVLRFLKPDGTALDVTPTVVSAEDGTIRHTFTSGQLNVAGRWKAQIKFTLGSWTGWSDIGAFEVGRVLKEPE